MPSAYAVPHSWQRQSHLGGIGGGGMDDTDKSLGKVADDGVGFWANETDELPRVVETRRLLRGTGDRGGDGGLIGYSSFGIDPVCADDDVSILTRSWRKLMEIMVKNL